MYIWIGNFLMILQLNIYFKFSPCSWLVANKCILFIPDFIQINFCTTPIFKSEICKTYIIFVVLLCTILSMLHKYRNVQFLNACSRKKIVWNFYFKTWIYLPGCCPTPITYHIKWNANCGNIHTNNK